jgi:hypothetical protein
MYKKKVYSALVHAIKSGKLDEPFGQREFRSMCPGFGEGSYKAFLHEHKKGNLAGETELFEWVLRGKFHLLRPFRYGL